MSPGVSQDAHSLSSALNTPVVCASIAACSRSVKDATISANDSQNPPQIHDDDGTPAASSHQQSPSPPPPVASPVSITSHQLAQSQIINGETDNAALLETSGPFNATHTVSADITRSEGDEDPLVRANDSQSPTQIHDDDGPPAASSHQQSSFPPPPAPSPVPSTSQHPDQQQALDRKSADAASQDPASRDAAALPKISDAAKTKLAELFQHLIEGFQVFEETVDGVRDLQVPPEGPVPKNERRVFLFFQPRAVDKKAREAARMNLGTAAMGGDRYNYEQKYPADEEGKGMDPNARVWRVYNDEASYFDLDMVENIRDTVDVILVFAGLFSAIVGGLVTQVSTALKPDYAQVTAALLIELIQVQRAMVAGTMASNIAPSLLNLDSPSTASTSERWVSGLWFVSLAVSLSAALLSVLVKQWVRAYVSPTSGTPKEQARVRHFRFMGIRDWHVPAIAGSLPILLHISLLLFFIGLVVLLRETDYIIAGLVTTIAVVVYTAYFITNLLPVWYPQCPYRTPLSSFALFVKQLCSTILRHLPARAKSLAEDSSTDMQEEPKKLFVSLQQSESSAIRNAGDQLDAEILTWLHETTSNPSVGAVVTYAISDLQMGFTALDTLRIVVPQACATLAQCVEGPWWKSQVREGMERTLYTCLQTHLHLSTRTSVKDPSPRVSCACTVRLVIHDSTISREPRLQIFDHIKMQKHCQNSNFSIRSERHGKLSDKLWPEKFASTGIAWITLLRQAVRYETNRSRGDIRTPSHFSIRRDLTQLQSLSSWQNQNNSLDNVYSSLDQILRAAYLCYWTKPEGVTVDIREEVPAALDGRGYAENITDDNSFPNHYHFTSFYEGHTAVHLLMHLAFECKASPEKGVLGLMKEIDISPALHDFDFETVELPVNHPLFDHIQHLFCSPESLDHTESQPFDYMDGVLYTILRLLTPHKELVHIPMTNRLLETLRVAHDHMVGPETDSFASLWHLARQYVLSVLNTLSVSEKRSGGGTNLVYVCAHLPHLFVWEVTSVDYWTGHENDYIPKLIDQIAECWPVSDNLGDGCSHTLIDPYNLPVLQETLEEYDLVQKALDFNETVKRRRENLLGEKLAREEEQTAQRLAQYLSPQDMTERMAQTGLELAMEPQSDVRMALQRLLPCRLRLRDPELAAQTDDEHPGSGESSLFAEQDSSSSLRYLSSPSSSAVSTDTAEEEPVAQ